jgi:MarR family 2-MHQ and catechol resistance regulon transcriptional repressor
MGESSVDVATDRALGVYVDMVDAAQTLDVLMSRALAPKKLTLNQYRVLAGLLREGPLSQQELNDRHFRTEYVASSTLASLEERGLVVRRGHEHDKRQRMVHLSPEGHAFIEELFPRHSRLVRAQLAALTGREQNTLRRLCQKLMDGNPLKFISELTLVEAEEDLRPNW